MKILSKIKSWFVKEVKYSELVCARKKILQFATDCGFIEYGRVKPMEVKELITFRNHLDKFTCSNKAEKICLEDTKTQIGAIIRNQIKKQTMKGEL
jgi:hypothetical protein